jgi:hypothetical protein
MKCGFEIIFKEGNKIRYTWYTCRESMSYSYKKYLTNPGVIQVGFYNPNVYYTTEEGIIVANFIKKILYSWNEEIEINIIGSWIYFQNYIPDKIEASFISAIIGSRKLLLKATSIKDIYSLFARSRIGCFMYSTSRRNNYMYYAYLLSKNDPAIRTPNDRFNGPDSFVCCLSRDHQLILESRKYKLE